MSIFNRSRQESTPAPRGSAFMNHLRTLDHNSSTWSLIAQWGVNLHAASQLSDARHNFSDAEHTFFAEQVTLASGLLPLVEEYEGFSDDYESGDRWGNLRDVQSALNRVWKAGYYEQRSVRFDPTDTTLRLLAAEAGVNVSNTDGSLSGLRIATYDLKLMHGFGSHSVDDVIPRGLSATYPQVSTGGPSDLRSHNQVYYQ